MTDTRTDIRIEAQNALHHATAVRKRTARLHADGTATKATASAAAFRVAYAIDQIAPHSQDSFETYLRDAYASGGFPALLDAIDRVIDMVIRPLATHTD